jgi:hypothetical protein
MDDVSEYIKGLTRSSKKDDLPGTVEAYLEEICPVPSCGKKLKLMRPCCGSPYGKKECVCGYKVNLSGDRS